MKRAPSMAPRFLGTLLVGFLLTVLGTTVFAWLAVGPLKLEPLLVVVVSVGFRLPFVAGGILVFGLAYLSDCLGGGILGLQVTAYVTVFVLCALAERKLEISSWPLQMAAVGVMSLIYQLMVAGGLTLVERQHLTPPKLLWLVAMQAVLSAFTAPVFFAFLELVVGMFNRVWLRLGGSRA